MRQRFLSQLVYQTYNGYVLSQFKKLQSRPPQQGDVKWKHVMHLIRLLLSGITRPARRRRAGATWTSIATGCWRSGAARCPGTRSKPGGSDLHREFDAAYADDDACPSGPTTSAPTHFLISARRSSARSDEPAMITTTRALLERRSRAHPYPLLFATISGAHLYGFPSPDSDYRPARRPRAAARARSSGSTPGRRRSRRAGVHDGLEIDLVTHDATKFFGLLLKKNGYVLEQLSRRWSSHTTPEHEELKALAPGCITRHHAHHYLGFAETQWKLFEKEHPPRVKPLLYVYRVLLTGIHLMRTGEVEANLVRLLDDRPRPAACARDLIERKRSRAREGNDSTTPTWRFHRGRVRPAASSELQDARLQRPCLSAPSARATSSTR